MHSRVPSCPNPRSVSLVASALVMMLCSLLATEGHAQEREYVNPRSPADGEVLPFSGAVRVGETLYLSGTIGLEDGQTVPATAEREARLVLESVKGTLEAAGMTMEDLVYVQVFSSDVSDYDAFNSVYRTYFEGEFPARAYIGAGTLLFGARFEVQSIAVRR